MEDSNETLCVGIDLGTSRSSISASNGERHVIDSYVGWPIDMVARKLVKKSVLVGREALENRPMLDLRRPLERGIMKEGSEKDQEAVQEILRHLLALAGVKHKGKNKAKVRAVVGVPAEAFRVNRQNLRNTMEGIADSVMLVSEPFAVAYGLEALLHALVIDIGAGTADFCVMQGRYPGEEDQKTLPNAGDSIDDQLSKLVRERFPEAQFSIHMIREWKEKWSFVGEPKGRVMVSVPVKGKETEIDITNEMRAACESILPPVCETMIGLLTKVEPEFQSKVRNNVILAGGSSLISGLPEAIAKALDELGGGKATVVKDPVFAGSDGSLAIARDASSSDWQKLSL
ncbi:MAG TPA: rod shape-determining protein [Candidatus Binatia bacterium]|jgi:rod shape-determining protein MreB|nr:rod shape-determining protein [Candidatus Binatia bacterium]